MPWINDVWVGKHDSRGIIVIGRQEKREDDALAVYFANQDKVAICKRSIMREHASEISVIDEDLTNAVKGYAALAHRIGVDLADTDLVIEHQKIQKEHQKFLERLGRTESSIRRNLNEVITRRTHCYSCKKLLDSSTDWECTFCNWILCECGACGCGYSGR